MPYSHQTQSCPFNKASCQHCHRVKEHGAFRIRSSIGYYRPIDIIRRANSSCLGYIHFTAHLSGHSNPLISCWCWDAYVCQVELHAYLHTYVRTGYVCEIPVFCAGFSNLMEISLLHEYPCVGLRWLGWLSDVPFSHCTLPDIHSESVSERRCDVKSDRPCSIFYICARLVTACLLACLL